MNKQVRGASGCFGSPDTSDASATRKDAVLEAPASTEAVWTALFTAHFGFYEAIMQPVPYLPHDAIMNAIRPYLATREPVSSNWKCNTCGSVEWDITDIDCRKCRKAEQPVSGNPLYRALTSDDFKQEAVDADGFQDTQQSDDSYWKSAFDQLRKEHDALLKRVRKIEDVLAYHPPVPLSAKIEGGK